jgi:hypothetical protein
LDQVRTLPRKNVERKALPQPATREYAKLAQQGLNLMFTDQPRSVKLEFFRAMEAKFPGREWASEGAKLQRDWERMDRIGATIV